ncbi:hypothetical protein K9O30_16850 [Clostridium bowmanii]|uniref:hypothetical protein n=1 Tax=Clostridium bowmanii TaxID=132925 RepID=UPI001C0CDF8F|nr:hypothetical protein [Clostridium bowmanii]MBU3191035.1 hypothetical protein [Clostridium bowmanii]MCA1075359.1 hypothetical protein [Clostridium bowmanii]
MGSKNFRLECNSNIKSSFCCKGYEDLNEILDITMSRDTNPYELKLGAEFLRQYLENNKSDVKLLLEHDIVTNAKVTAG